MIKQEYKLHWDNEINMRGLLPFSSQTKQQVVQQACNLI